MSKVFKILEAIFQTKGKEPKFWEILKNIIQNQIQEIMPFCFLIRNRINNGNKDEILLSLNILDFAVDNGNPMLWIQIDNQEFLLCIKNILQPNIDRDLQNSALYLIKKWAIKFQNYPSIQNCKNIFNSLKNNNVIFPNNINNSYLKYISQNYNNMNNNMYNMNNMNNNMNIMNNNMDNMNNMNNNMNSRNNNMYNMNNMNNNMNNMNNNMNNTNKNNNNMNNMNSNMKNKMNNHNNANKYNNINNYNNMNNNNNFINKNNLNNFNNNLNIKNNNFNNIKNIYYENKNAQENNNLIRQSRIETNPIDYVKNINLDLNINSYDRKYKRLINKLNDWTNQIQEINILINNNINMKNNSQLKILCDNLKLGYQKLTETIEGPKLKDEKLMIISLNVCEDMFMTLNRYEKLIKGENPGPFLSSFTRDDNPNLKKYANQDNRNYNFYDLKNRSPLEEINNLFGKSIKAEYFNVEDNNDNDNNNLSDLFEKENESIQINLDKNEDINNNNHFFNNMSNISNNDINYNNGNINKNQDYKELYDSNKSNNLNMNDIKANTDMKKIINNNPYENNKTNYKIYQTQKLPYTKLNLNNI